MEQVLKQQELLEKCFQVLHSKNISKCQKKQALMLYKKLHLKNKCSICGQFKKYGHIYENGWVCLNCCDEYLGGCGICHQDIIEQVEQEQAV